MRSRHAGGLGHPRPHRSSVGPDHAQTTALHPWQETPWGLPPPANAAGVWAMAEVREVSTRPYAARRPQGGLDETRTHLGAAPREPIPAAPGPSARVADADARQGPAHLCMVFEPVAGPRPVKGPERRTAIDCAPVLQAWGDGQSPQAETRVLGLDTLNTHRPASWSDAWAPAEARRLRERLAIPDTPTPGRWLTMAETALSGLATPGWDRRLPDSTTRTPAVAAWARPRQTATGRVDGRFPTHDARLQLQRLSPSIQLGCGTRVARTNHYVKMSVHQRMVVSVAADTNLHMRRTRPATWPSPLRWAGSHPWIPDCCSHVSFLLLPSHFEPQNAPALIAPCPLLC